MASVYDLDYMPDIDDPEEAETLDRLEKLYQVREVYMNPTDDLNEKQMKLVHHILHSSKGQTKIKINCHCSEL